VTTELNPKYRRQRVAYSTQQPAGTVVVDPDAKFLYLVMADGTALRYGIGVGREGFGWSGTAEVSLKARWPRWTPPAAMIRRQPELERYRKGMEPGLGNPLGARALYLYQNGRDTLYRIHGTDEASSIGQNVSSSCIRLLNQDVIDLFARVSIGTRVVVLPSEPASPIAAGGELERR
jgi:lipoprotein-anchoring transpeptidase ErfK/SrfK